VPNDAERGCPDAPIWLLVALFAASGDLNGASAVAWPAYDAAVDSYLRLDTPIVAGEGVRTAQCDFWERLAGAR
jgi:hypothetical protein